MNGGSILFPGRLRAVFFDLDGTLIDTADEFIPALQALRREHGYEPMDPQRIRATVSNGARALVSLGLDMPETAPEFENNRQRLLQLYGELLGTAASLYPGVQALLERLHAAGIAWGISTNKPRQLTAGLLARLDIRPPPATVVCPEDITDRKPHPETLYRNCRDIDCAPCDAVYIGDHRRDIEAGRRAGMFTIAAAYGYIEPGDDPGQWGAAASIERSDDLLEFFVDRCKI